MGQLVLPQGTAFTRVINLSETCPTPTALPDDAHHFLRIPIKDSYCAKLLPHFDAAFKFIDEARKTGGKVLVHCVQICEANTVACAALISFFLSRFDDDGEQFNRRKQQHNHDGCFIHCSCSINSGHGGGVQAMSTDQPIEKWKGMRRLELLMMHGQHKLAKIRCGGAKMYNLVVVVVRATPWRTAWILRTTTTSSTDGWENSSDDNFRSTERKQMLDFGISFLARNLNFHSVDGFAGDRLLSDREFVSLLRKFSLRSRRFGA
uniref:protein-tyrosine-phosphatase n=1 Tax=Globodera rostochiensis TaxID=31243 RepID=A0A914HVS3_GLORO